MEDDAMVEVRAVGQKLLRLELGPLLWIKTIFPMHQDGGAALLGNLDF